MKVITANVNSIRAAAKKGFFQWLEKEAADIVCLQETKAQESQLEAALFFPEGYQCYYHDALKKGYSGVAIFCKKPPSEIILGLNNPLYDNGGRHLEVCYPGLSIISVYMPSGSSGEERQAFKYGFLDFYFEYLKKLKEKGQELIICGDWNIAHKPIDLKNWRTNQKSSGFLPEERAWLDRVFNEQDYVDAFRVLNKEPDQYTWWSLRTRAWEKNVGWRIDYQIVTPGLEKKIKAVSIYKDEKFSDHAPLLVNYDL